jgi:hypothetical protein
MTWRHWIVRAKEYNLFGKSGTDFGLTGVVYQKNGFLNLKTCSECLVEGYWFSTLMDAD